MRTLTIAITLILLFLAPLYAGDIDQSSPPSNDATRMYTLEQIYQAVASGTAATKQSGGFNEPATGPGSTMHTLDQTYAKIATGTTDAAVGDVLASKTFISRAGAGSGESRLTGTMTDREGDNVSTAQAAAAGVNYFTAPAGFYDGDDRVSATDAQIAALDADIAVGNIKSGVAIFGVSGTFAGTYGVPKTGQTTSYATGDDGDLEKGTPASGDRFTNTPGTSNSVTDNGTGLIWIKSHAAIGTVGGYNFANTMTWANALLAVAALNAANYDGSNQWRLPNIKELQSIVDYGRVNPSINTTYFTSQSDGYWSGTTVAGVTDYAWSVYFSYGSVYSVYKGSGIYVRPVRGG